MSDPFEFLPTNIQCVEPPQKLMFKITLWYSLLREATENKMTPFGKSSQYQDDTWSVSPIRQPKAPTIIYQK